MSSQIFQWPTLAGKDISEQCDVAIVGSGCGGAALAMRLAEAGKSVVIIERGGYYTKEDFDQRELNMLARIAGGRGLDTSADGSIALTYGNNVGGASVHYWADSYRLPEDRAAQWRDVFGMEGHDSKILTRHFAEIEKNLNIHPAADAYVNRMNALVRDAAQKLGWVVHRVPQARRGCVASGFCMQGCAYDAKQSQLVTYVPRALAAGARLYADTRAIGLRFSRAASGRLAMCCPGSGDGAAHIGASRSGRQGRGDRCRWIQYPGVAATLRIAAALVSPRGELLLQSLSHGARPL